ncbi:cold-responsive protein kinase 1-like [Tasmannia lanceolata]|uniref:cold-responsive protein kinase 1-like n=1 Tax=Tasmannia lanceolata TaxID=3420 RepID=UPI004064939F
MSWFSCLFRKSETNPAEPIVNVDEEVSGIQNVKLYSYNELRIATDDFSHANKIGEGGFGCVYKGKLKDGKLAAIKVLSAKSSQGIKEFLAELTVISHIVHENLVKLHGCCVEGIHRILVYGYVENNSLSQTLLGRKQSNIQFSWSTRSKICIGVACGLAFLHEEVEPHVVHRDIKASNILLDKDLTPKIADFGLAKLFPSNVTHISTRVAGTIGYLAPEYAIRGQLTRKADIYSFGVLLLEIVSGRCNRDRQLPFERHYLLERAWFLHESGKLANLVDKSLSKNYNVEEADRFLKIALLCTQDEAKRRPSMSNVVKMLTGVMEVDEQKITKPGLISEFEFKIRDTKGKAAEKNTRSTTGSSGTSHPETSSTSSANPISYATMSITAISKRSS